MFDGPAVKPVPPAAEACVVVAELGAPEAASTPSTVTGPVTVTFRVAETGRVRARLSPTSTEPASTAPACTGAAAEDPNAISCPLRVPT